jgi:hypothetical protein
MTLQAEQAHHEQRARPSRNAVSILFAWLTAIAILAGAAAAISLDPPVQSFMALAAGIFIGLLMAAIASALRWLQLIEWRLR